MPDVKESVIPRNPASPNVPLSSAVREKPTFLPDTEKLDISMPSSEVMATLETMSNNQGRIPTTIYHEYNSEVASPLKVSELFPPTPSVTVFSKEEAFSPQLYEFCLQKPIVLIRNLAHVCDIDLSLYTTKSLVQAHPSHPVEIR